jgi:Na+-translocating ferredoxin:NAD+ oxidoreductase RnfC subunit
MTKSIEIAKEAKKLRPEDTEYAGTYGSIAEFGKRSSIDCGDCPSALPAYIDENIDWEAVGERLLVQDYTYEVGKLGLHFYRIT